jgi:hypothetical protein
MDKTPALALMKKGDETAGNAGGKDLIKVPSRLLRADFAQRTKAPKGN